MPPLAPAARASRSKLESSRRGPSLGPEPPQARRATTSPVAASWPAAGLISTLACRPSSSSKATASVERRHPLAGELRREPAAGIQRTDLGRGMARAPGPRPSVVRCSVSSWIRTGTPSRLSMTSNSTQRAPSSCASRRPGQRVLRRAAGGPAMADHRLPAPAGRLGRPGDQGCQPSSRIAVSAATVRHASARSFHGRRRSGKGARVDRRLDGCSARPGSTAREPPRRRATRSLGGHRRARAVRAARDRLPGAAGARRR